VSTTRTEIWAVPDLGGSPPSTAVSTSLACCSLSKAFSSTNSGYLLPSPRVCISKRKCSSGLRV
uniref:Uncharacterized protein n=1 Tax=Nothoprocta perdicaria TaxID=30464 RepID=A0A8C6YNH0_NOTPE